MEKDKLNTSGEGEGAHIEKEFDESLNISEAIQSILKKVLGNNSINYKEIRSINKKTREIIIKLMKNFHKNDKRDAKSAITNEPFRYEIHPEEVNKRAWDFLNRIYDDMLPEDKIITKKNLSLIDIISLFHDVVEDCKPSDSFKTIQDEVKKGLSEIKIIYKSKIKSIDKSEIKSGLNKIDLLTKPSDENEIDEETGLRKKDLELFKRLKEGAPFFVKIIKLADQSHNLSTLGGKEIEKALKNYIKIRKSWPIIFSEEELEILYKNKILESPKRMVNRTKAFENILQNIDTKEGKRALKNKLINGIIRLDAISQPGESELLNALHVFNPDALKRILNNYTIENLKSDIDLVYKFDENINNAETLNFPIEKANDAKNTLLIFRKEIVHLKKIKDQTELNNIINVAIKKLFFRVKQNMDEFGEDADVPNEFLEIMLSYLNITKTKREFNELTCLDIAKKLENISNQDLMESIPLL